MHHHLIVTTITTTCTVYTTTMHHIQIPHTNPTTQTPPHSASCTRASGTQKNTTSTSCSRRSSPRVQVECLHQLMEGKHYQRKLQRSGPASVQDGVGYTTNMQLQPPPPLVYTCFLLHFNCVLLYKHHIPIPPHNHATPTRQCKMHKCKWSICASGWMEKHQR